MKKIIALILTLSMLFCFVCCTNDTEDVFANALNDETLSTEEMSLQNAKDLITELQNQILELEDERSNLASSYNSDLEKSKAEIEELTAMISLYRDIIGSYDERLQSSDLFIETQKNDLSDLPVYNDGDIILESDEWASADLPCRFSYYWSFGTVVVALWELRGYENDGEHKPSGEMWSLLKEEFMGEYDEEAECWTIEPKEHTVLTLIKEYQITREEMEVILLMLQDTVDANSKSELNELPNLDILYTFDNDIINEYYRRA